MRVLITGCAGYVGSMLTPRLLHRGWTVTAVDRFPHGMPFLALCCANSAFTPIRGDIGDPEIQELVPKHDVIVNLAAIVGAPACDRDMTDTVRTNQWAVKQIARQLSRDQIMVQPTSDSGYGIGYAANICTEEHALNPTSLYGKTKVEAEKEVIGARGISLRLASVFGASPRMRIDLLVNEFVW